MARSCCRAKITHIARLFTIVVSFLACGLAHAQATEVPPDNAAIDKPTNPPAPGSLDAATMRQVAIDKMKAELAQVKEQALRERVYHRIAVGLAHTEPRLAFDTACMMKDRFLRKWALTSVMAAWAESDFDAARQAAQELSGDHSAVLKGLVRGAELESALALISKVEDRGSRDDLRIVLIARLASAGRLADAEDVLNHIESTFSMKAAVCKIIRYSDDLGVPKARELVARIKSPRSADSPLCVLAEPEEACDHLWEAALAIAKAQEESVGWEEAPVIHDLFGKWADSDPKATLQLLNHISGLDDIRLRFTLRPRLLMEIVARWSATDPAAAKTWVEENTEYMERDYAAAGITLGQALSSEAPNSSSFDDVSFPMARERAKRRFIELKANDQFPAALEIAASEESGVYVERMLSYLVGAVAESDPDNAIVAIGRMPYGLVKIGTLTELVRNQSRDYPATKAALSTACAHLFDELRQNTDNVGRSMLLCMLGEGWATCDPFAARRVLNEIPSNTARQASGENPDDMVAALLNIFGGRATVLEAIAQYGSKEDAQRAYEWALGYEGPAEEKAVIWLGIAEGLSPGHSPATVSPGSVPDGPR